MSLHVIALQLAAAAGVRSGLVEMVGVPGRTPAPSRLDPPLGFAALSSTAAFVASQVPYAACG